MGKIQVRRGLFETNSSSVHSMTMCSESDFEKWKKGELVFDNYAEALIPVTDDLKEYIKSEDNGRYHEYLTYDQFFDYCVVEYETFVKSHVTEHGDKVVAFGYYGNDY